MKYDENNEKEMDFLLFWVVFTYSQCFHDNYFPNASMVSESYRGKLQPHGAQKGTNRDFTRSRKPIWFLVYTEKVGRSSYRWQRLC